jgi:flotillin
VKPTRKWPRRGAWPTPRRARRWASPRPLQIIAPILPDIARAIAEPLSRIDRITMVGTGNGADGVSKITSEVAKVIAQVPPVVESLTGLRLDDLLARLQEPKSDAGPNGTAATPPN